MARELISTGSEFEKIAGYSRAVKVGNMIFVSGTTGYNYSTMTIPEDIITQTHNCFQTIAETLEKLGSSLKDIVRVTYYIVDIKDADIVFPIFGYYLGDIRPAATLLVVAGLYKPEMKIEIEITSMIDAYKAV